MDKIEINRKDRAMENNNMKSVLKIIIYGHMSEVKQIQEEFLKVLTSDSKE